MRAARSAREAAGSRSLDFESSRRRADVLEATDDAAAALGAEGAVGVREELLLLSQQVHGEQRAVGAEALLDGVLDAA